jgi:hypothetical protein
MIKPRITPIVMPENKPVEKGESGLHEGRRKIAETAAVNISRAFTWDETAEGYDFWSSVCARLLAISNGEPLK